ncbi:MAG: TetR/AcrR family transcriptional regulator, partial [Actinobacteria bacterium]|nr:TetR/AcrR family transcriptional regulator [Actinomycetota bacterium]
MEAVVHRPCGNDDAVAQYIDSSGRRPAPPQIDVLEYRSGIRRDDAPALVCEAAYRLFSTKGYVNTSSEDIAAEAGVARPTVFSAVGPKPDILRTVVEQALAGDDA